MPGAGTFVVIGGIAYAVHAAGEHAVLKPGDTGYTVPASGSTGPQRHVRVNMFGSIAPLKSMGSPMALDPTKQPSAYPGSNNIDPALGAKLDAIGAAAKAQFDNMDAVARVKAADQLNKSLKLDPPLNGHEGWDTISAVVGGAAGAAAGAAIGGPIGAKIGALCGAYLGTKVETLLAEPLGDLWDRTISGWFHTGTTSYKSVEDAIDALRRKRDAHEISDAQYAVGIAAINADKARDGFHGLNPMDKAQILAVVGITSF